MKTRVTVVSAEQKDNYYPVAGGAPRKVTSHKCKIILHLPDGGIDVGTLTVPEALAPEGVTPGDYHVEYRAGRGFSEDKIIGVMFSFEGVASAGKAVAQPADKAQKA